MYENFSKKAQVILILAESIAREYDFKQIEPLFLFLAFLYAGETPNVPVFQNGEVAHVKIMTIENIIFKDYYGINIWDKKYSEGRKKIKGAIVPSEELNKVLKAALINSKFYSNKEVTLENLLFALFASENLLLQDFFESFIVNKDFLKDIVLDDCLTQADMIEKAEKVWGWSWDEDDGDPESEDLKKLKDAIKIQVSNVPLLQISKQETEDISLNISSKMEPETLEDSVERGFTTNLTMQAAVGDINPVIGRDKEIKRMIQILSRRTKNNPLLIGESGIGKSATVKGLALRLASGFIPEYLKNKNLIEVHIGAIIAGTKHRGAFEEKLKAILTKATESDQVILVIDELHMLSTNAGGENGLDVAGILKPFLLNDKIQFIGSITTVDYKQIIEPDLILARRFQSIKVEEPTVADTVSILRSLREDYEDFHNVRYTNDALVAAAKLSSQYIADRFLPDKAIDLLDEAGARVRLKSFTIPEAAVEMYKQLQILKHAKEQGEESEAYKKLNIDYMKFNIKSLNIAAQNQDQERIRSGNSKRLIVHESDISEMVALWSGIPVNKISKGESENLLKMEDTLHERIIGQHEAVVAVSNAIRRARVGLKNPNRPIASFIFAGPTGVGKTELTKALAFNFFGSEKNMVRLDMSEYMERHTVAKLIGAPPGYIGYNEGGQLTEAVRSKPYTVVLFDEIEKAHPDIFNLLLQVLEDGHLTDSKGRRVDFKNTVIILTSNVGAKVIENTTLQFADVVVGEGKDNSTYQRIRRLVTQELKNQFKPEFLNRLDEIIIFSQLTKDDISQIADILINQLTERLWDQNGILLFVTDRVRKRLIDEGFDPLYGARPLRRAATNILEDNLSSAFLGEEILPNTNVIIDIGLDNNIKVFVEKNEDDSIKINKQ